MRSVDYQPDKGKRISQTRVESQRDFVLNLLRQAGTAGISKIHFISGTGPCCGRRITQISARIFELEADGFRFEHRKPDDSPFTIFILTAEPNQESEAGQLTLGLPNRSAALSEFAQRERGEHRA